MLSPGSAEPWDDSDEVWVSADGIVGIPDAWGSSAQNISATEHNQANVTRSDNVELQPSSSRDGLVDEIDNKVVQHEEEPSKVSELDMGSPSFRL